jgi:hypothetical protein
LIPIRSLQIINALQALIFVILTNHSADKMSALPGNIRSINF